jgi:anthranilate/para-aminobenzoate synthase component I
VGRLAEPGTVETSPWMEVEQHSQALCLASSVRGRLGQEVGPLDLVRACFPAAGDCGAPRDRALDLIEQLEPAARGAHIGALGYFDHRGGLDLCSSAHTLALAGGRAEWGAGAVIAADTDPEAAWRETQDQARGPGLALQRAAGAGR